MHTAFVCEDLAQLSGRAEALVHHGNKLYVGNADGELYIYELLPSDTETSHASGSGQADKVSLLKSVPHFAPKSIDQLGILKETHSLVCRSDGNVQLYDLTTLDLQTSLGAQTKAQASLFRLATQARSQPVTPAKASPVAKGKARAAAQSQAEEIVLWTTLAVTCKRRLLLLRWRDGQWQEPLELSLPHQVRSMTFPNPETLFLGYSTQTYGLVKLRPNSKSNQPLLSEVNLSGLMANATAGQSATLGLGGLAIKTAGYTGIGGIGRVQRNLTATIRQDEMLIVQDDQGYLVDPQGKRLRSHSLAFPAAPDHIESCSPYFLSALPASAPAKLNTPGLAVYTLETFSLVQSLTLPNSASKPEEIKALAASSGQRPLLYALSIATDSQGGRGSRTRLWQITMSSWSSQLDQLTRQGDYQEASALLGSLDQSVLPDKMTRFRRLQILAAVKQLDHRRQWDAAIDVFIQFDSNPSKVISLFTEAIAGKLHKPFDEREATFGGRAAAALPIPKASNKKADSVESDAGSVTETLRSLSPDQASPREDSILKGKRSKSDLRQSSLGQRAAEAKLQQRKRESIEVLIRYLTDRRQNINKALSNRQGSTKPSVGDETEPLDVPAAFALPDGPLTELSIEQLYTIARIVDTTLFRSYLAVRPTLLGPLCRIENWCDASEVEDLLFADGRINELLDLFRVKKQHKKALELLRRTVDESMPVAEQVEDTVAYLHRLGAENIELVCETSLWVFSLDFGAGLQIFTADSEDVESWPRHEVASHLRAVSDEALTAYLEHIIYSLHDAEPDFHDQLINLYLQNVLASPKFQRKDARDYAKLLAMLQTSTQYRADRTLSRLPGDDLYEFRALLLGRLERHEGALRIYVNRLGDFAAAEAYCQSVYASGTTSSGNIFSVLLQLYLRPKDDANPRFEPALSLLASQGTKINAIEALELLPPVMTIRDLRTFLHKTLRHGREIRNGLSLDKNVYAARRDGLDREKAALEGRRVRITDSRLCPQCHKRLGSSVVAIHMPHGHVTHYNCREQWHAHKASQI
ncbi:uncharacterized protein L969DRAFT_85502 [Mixia osmundae IAM 14324]|uniref:uncharacterized protein n=1 Tax=Mixia osmundae (strain CBS 9802 / IAM 14324 / JCM 22182 / KY 12970) TaxID=764103 RepID=UPI0004A552FD|nr:uncharacterized protein L969DRAFT_85502 [Mixia osmundae IAM 14324]KEI41687.1 hypothetical protein L969DRAFT_85502 [Mixia osmundae IAM 14324]